MKQIRAPSGPKTTRWVVVVRPITPGKYPEYQSASDHPFAGMDPAKRTAELDAACARLWVRSCEEARMRPAKTDEPGRFRRAA